MYNNINQIRDRRIYKYGNTIILLPYNINRFWSFQIPLEKKKLWVSGFYPSALNSTLTSVLWILESTHWVVSLALTELQKKRNIVFLSVHIIRSDMIQDGQSPAFRSNKALCYWFIVSKIERFFLLNQIDRYASNSLDNVILCNANISARDAYVVRLCSLLTNYQDNTARILKCKYYKWIPFTSSSTHRIDIMKTCLRLL